ncbi:MAG TPA: hypothetical protein VFW07_07670 [Parafilimonas sp.]|nr:hypothetical protein [Parafilimonas sp.]
MLEFLKIIIQFLNNNHIEYMLSGSVALGAYTLPRATRDFDFIVNMKEEGSRAFNEYFKVGYYCDEDSIKEAIRQKGMFNIIDHASGFRAGFVVLKENVFRRNEFERRIKITLFNMEVYIVSAEDLLLSKLIWIQDFQSNLQIEDIKSLIQYKNIDMQYVIYWIEKLRLNTFNII